MRSCTFPVLGVTLIQMQDLCKRNHVDVLRAADDLCINLFQGSEEDLALLLSALDSCQVALGTSLAFHCHLKDLKG